MPIGKRFEIAQNSAANAASRWTRYARGAALAVGVLASFGCSSLKDGSDTTQPLGKSDLQWDCVENKTPAPAPPDPMLHAFHYHVAIVDFVNAPSELDPTIPVPDAAIPNLSVLVCKAIDPDCSTPVTAPVTTPLAAAGYPYVYQIDIPGGLDALLLKITEAKPPADILKAHVPTVYYFAGALVGSDDGQADITGEAIPIPTFGQLLTFGTDFGVKPDSTRGTIAVRTIDCNGKRAAKVSLSLTPSRPEGVAYQLSEQGVPLAGEPGQPLVTDLRGVAGFANLIPGSFRVSGITPYGTTYGNSAARIGPSQFTVVEVRPDSLRPR